MSDFRRPSRFLLTTHRQLCATIRTRAQWDGSVKCVQWECEGKGGTAGGCRCWNALGGQNSRHTIAIVNCLPVALSKLSLPIDRCGQFHLLLPQEFSQFSDKLKGTCNTLIGRLISRLANVAKNNIAVVPPSPYCLLLSTPAPAQLAQHLHFGTRQRGVRSAKGLNYRKSGFGATVQLMAYGLLYIDLPSTVFIVYHISNTQKLCVLHCAY